MKYDTAVLFIIFQTLLGQLFTIGIAEPLKHASGVINIYIQKYFLFYFRHFFYNFYRVFFRFMFFEF